MPDQSTTPSAADTLAEISRLSDRRAALWEQPYRTSEELAEISRIDAHLAQLWDQRRLQLAEARAAAAAAEEQAEAQRRQSARALAGLVAARPVELHTWELAQVPALARRTPLSDAEVRAIRQAYAERRHGDITRLAGHRWLE